MLPLLYILGALVLTSTALTPPDNWIGLVPQSAIGVILLWLGKRFLQQNEALLKALNSTLVELEKSRVAMQEAKAAFEKNTKSK